MGMGYETRYKDCAPIQTVEKIRGILSGLGILTSETWYNDVEGYYSLFLCADKMGLFSNGKGTTRAYALASAYAEMIERIQNLAFVTINMGGNGNRREAAAYRGFRIAPDEKMVSIEELASDDSKWLQALTDGALTRKEKLEILKEWQSTDDYSDGEGFLSLPYTNLIDGSECYIPVTMLGNAYMSNGMSAGNTGREALVQGLSEVLERYVQKKIVYDRITPPDVPESYIAAHYPYLHAMIKSLEGKGDFNVVVKDCSLGRVFPSPR